MLDYIIVGSGLAGISFSETLLNSNNSFCVFNTNKNASTKVAAGLYNSVILKRFNLVWKAQEQINLLPQFYGNIEQKTNVKLDYNLEVRKRFTSTEDQNEWFVAVDKQKLETFLDAQIISNSNENVNAPFGFGKVLQTGYVDVSLLYDVYQLYLQDLGVFQNEVFDYDNLIMHLDGFEYNGIKAKNIVFAEGFGLHQNPFFNFLPLDGSKGELLKIHAPNLKLDYCLNSSLFILPIGNDNYKVAATYNWTDKDSLPTEEGKKELLDKLDAIINCEYTVLEHFAGVRPTVLDRRPLVGEHPIHKSMYILNGLGTRGVMLGPYLAQLLFDSIENKTELDPQVDVDFSNPSRS
jgi:glycine oxidase